MPVADSVTAEAVRRLREQHAADMARAVQINVAEMRERCRQEALRLRAEFLAGDLDDAAAGAFAVAEAIAKLE